MKQQYRHLFVELLPLAVGFTLEPFIHGEVQFTAVIIAILIISLAIRYNEGEWKLFVLGLLLGFFVEVLSGLIYRMQYWKNASLLGVPYWLPIFWGYGFIFIHRIGNAVVGRSKDRDGSL